MTKPRTDRRSFIRTSARTAAGLTVMSSLPRSVLGANDRLRVGLIGCGGRGNYLLGETLALATDRNVEVAALCDVWRVNLEKTAARVAAHQPRKPQTFARYMDLLSMKDLDAVLIATPDFAHTPILIEAIKLKKDAFVEKPMATVLEHANAAVKLAKENGTVVLVAAVAPALDAHLDYGPVLLRQVGAQRRSD